jgi:hypothetical protein
VTAPAAFRPRFPGRSRLGAARRAVRGVLQQADPSRLLLVSPPPGLRVGCVCVYRLRNVPVLRPLLRALPPGAAVRLWCLDGDRADVPEDLAGATVGTGPGTRFALLNRLVAALPAPERADALVLLDDDVRFAVGDVGRLVATGLASLDLFQPGHAATSHASWSLVHRWPLTVLRRTGLVEQGPLLVLSAAAQRSLLPLPEDLDMGWGSEVRWAGLAERDGLRQGVVDAVSVVHLVPAGGTYDREAQELLLAGELRAAGLRTLDDLMTTTERLSVVQALRDRGRSRNLVTRKGQPVPRHRE